MSRSGPGNGKPEYGTQDGAGLALNSEASALLFPNVRGRGPRPTGLYTQAQWEQHPWSCPGDGAILLA